MNKEAMKDQIKDAKLEKQLSWQQIAGATPISTEFAVSV